MCERERERYYSTVGGFSCPSCFDFEWALRPVKLCLLLLQSDSNEPQGFSNIECGVGRGRGEVRRGFDSCSDLDAS